MAVLRDFQEYWVRCRVCGKGKSKKDYSKSGRNQRLCIECENKQKTTVKKNEYD